MISGGALHCLVSALSGVILKSFCSAASFRKLETFITPLSGNMFKSGIKIFFLRVVRLYHVISFLRISTYRSILVDYNQIAL